MRRWVVCAGEHLPDPPLRFSWGIRIVIRRQRGLAGYLERLGIAALMVRPDPVRIAAAGALWGCIQCHGLLQDTVVDGP